MILETALMCLALNVFHESKSEPLEGQQAIAQVTMNRAEGRVENVCKTVLEPYQFSWTNKTVKKPFKQRLQDLQRVRNQITQSRNPKIQEAWQRALNVADDAIHDRVESRAKHAFYYYNPKTDKPKWRKTFVVVCKIGNHVFLKAA